MNVNIKVKNRVAETVGYPTAVCGGIDTLTFQLDEEWEEYPEKFLGVIYVSGGRAYRKTVAFTGNTVTVPEVEGCERIYIGIYAEGEKGVFGATTPVGIPYRRSILSPAIEDGGVVLEEGWAVPDFSMGDQTILPEKGSAFSRLVLECPEALLPENIVSGVEIAGISGCAESRKPEEDLSCILDFSMSDVQMLLPREGHAIASVLIDRPDTLIPENLRFGVTVAGVLGSMGGSKPEEDLSCILDFSEGNTQVILPTESENTISSVTVMRPDTLLPENIVNGITVAGVTGTAVTGEAPPPTAIGREIKRYLETVGEPDYRETVEYTVSADEIM